MLRNTLPMTNESRRRVAIGRASSGSRSGFPDLADDRLGDRRRAVLATEFDRAHDGQRPFDGVLEDARAMREARFAVLVGQLK